MHDITRYYTIFTISNGVVKTPRDNFDPWSNTKKCSAYAGHFLLSLGEQLNLPLRASEVILDSEVHFVSEVLPNGKVANLTSLGA